MGTVKREDGYHIVVFSDDHPLAHVHVRRSGYVAKFRLEPVELIANYGFKPAELRKAQELVEKHRDAALQAWDSIHPRR